MKTVLLVDDEDDIITVGSLALSEVGELEVTTARSGEEALRILETMVPDVIVLDVMMPGMDGPTTLARLRERSELAGVPVIFLTAKAQLAELPCDQTLGAAGVIPKPFDPMTLADQIRRIASK